MTYTSFRFGHAPRTDSILSRCSSFSAKAMRTCASLKIISTCAGEFVSYTGTVNAPMDMIAISRAVHCQQVCEITETESPGITPRAISPLARETTRSLNSVAVNDCHRPWASLYSTKESCGVRLARSSRMENRLTLLSIGSCNGRVYSLSMSLPDDETLTYGLYYGTTP